MALFKNMGRSTTAADTGIRLGPGESYSSDYVHVSTAAAAPTPTYITTLPYVPPLTPIPNDASTVLGMKLGDLNRLNYALMSMKTTLPELLEVLEDAVRNQK